MAEADGTGHRSGSAARRRTCCVTREVKDEGELLRFVRGPDGTVVPDLKSVLPGRGVWVTASAEAVSEAVRRKAFARGFRGEADAAGLADTVDRLLLERARQALAIANKAGQVVTGFGKVEAAVARKPLALVHAADAAEDGAAKLDRRFRAVAGEDAPVFRLLPGAEMDLAFGRSNVVHAALDRGPAAMACLIWFRKLLRYRADRPSRPVRTGAALGTAVARTDSE